MPIENRPVSGWPAECRFGSGSAVPINAYARMGRRPRNRRPGGGVSHSGRSHTYLYGGELVSTEVLNHRQRAEVPAGLVKQAGILNCQLT